MSGLDFDRFDRDGALAETAAAAQPDSHAAALTRGGLLFAGASVVLGAAAAPAAAQGGGLSAGDRAVLNYALVLEYLQAAFYTEAERLGALRGDSLTAARVIGGVERAHVTAFREQLGSDAVKRPAFDFQGTTERSDAFLKTAVALEDLAVAAYGGQASRLESKQALAAALAIHSVEARHAAWMRYLVGAQPAAKAFDEPRPKSEIDRLVKTTGFVSDRPSMRRRRRPRFTG